MLVLVQFPLADLRPFVAERPKKEDRPDWSLPPDPATPDFVRGFGPLRSRPGLSSLTVATWPSEGWFARVDHGIRLPQLNAAQFSVASAVPRHAVRRLFCDGLALWRLEVGIGFDLKADLDAQQTMDLVQGVLEMPVRVRVRGELGPALPLIQSGAAIEASLTAASTFAKTPNSVRLMKLRRGRPMVMVETNATADEPPRIEVATATPGARRVVLGEADAASRIEVDYATLRVNRADLPIVWLHSAWRDNAKRVSAVRTHMCRLHAEREVLTQVLRASNRGLLDDATPAFERYLDRADRDLFAQERFGVEQSELRRIFDVYDQIAPAERQALADILGRRRQSGERAERLVQSYRSADERITIVLPGATMNDNRVTILGPNYGNINVAGTFINTGKIISGVGNTELKSALEALHDQAKQLAERLPEDADKEGVANRTEALTKAATAAKPDKSMLKVTGEGLIEAAKTVAGMAGPIATAVGAVLGIFGLVI
jgi:hypothetical protein